jgi:hypothetical protein
VERFESEALSRAMIESIGGRHEVHFGDFFEVHFFHEGQAD